MGTSFLGPCTLCLVVFHHKTPILNCFYHLLWFYFLTDPEFSPLAMLGRPYPLSGWREMAAPDRNQPWLLLLRSTDPGS